MKQLLLKYYLFAGLEFSFILIDLFVNNFSNFVTKENVALLLLFMVQLICLIFGIILFVLYTFSTYAFQAGLTDVLYIKFRTTVTWCIVYIFTTVAVNIWSLSARWNDPNQQSQPDGFLGLLVIQKFMAVFHYFFVKRSVLRIADPRFYQ